MRLLKIIISLYLLSCTHCAILSKYDSITITSEEVIFESKDFDDDEDMHFKIKSDKFNFGKVYDDLFGNRYDVEYYYCDSTGNKRGNYEYNIYFKKSETEDGYDIRYFTITKKRSEYRPSNGDYIKIKFNFMDRYWAIITNTEEDEGKLETWVIIVIVVVVVLIIAGIVIFCVCRCIKNRKAMAALNSAAAANMQAQNQAYAAQINQNAYIAGQNYQAQANQAQVFQNPVNASPAVPPDAGYTSKAVM